MTGIRAAAVTVPDEAAAGGAAVGPGFLAPPFGTGAPVVGSGDAEPVPCGASASGAVEPSPDGAGEEPGTTRERTPVSVPPTASTSGVSSRPGAGAGSGWSTGSRIGQDGAQLDARGGRRSGLGRLRRQREEPAQRGRDRGSGAQAEGHEDRGEAERASETDLRDGRHGGGHRQTPYRQTARFL